MHSTQGMTVQQPMAFKQEFSQPEQQGMMLASSNLLPQNNFGNFMQQRAQPGNVTYAYEPSTFYPPQD